MKKVIDFLREYSPNVYPVSSNSIDLLSDDYQDSSISDENCCRDTVERPQKPLASITNVLENANYRFTRDNTFFSYFLDGTRRAYYVSDITTGDGSLAPVLAGQISAAVLERSRETGKLSVLKYGRKGLLLVPAGPNGLPPVEAEELKRKIENNWPGKLNVELVKMRNKEEPKNNGLAKLNSLMQQMEISYLEELTNEQRIDQNNMLIVDGALQFQNVTSDRLNNLRFAIGLSKSFNTHLTNVIGRNKEIGTILVQLKNVGDRTPAYKLRVDAKEYAFWYLRMKPIEYCDHPMAGIVKAEKVLVSPEEKEDGISSDIIDHISQCLLLENFVAPHGNDFRWASHIYPIYLTEQLQKAKFESDLIFRSYFM